MCRWSIVHANGAGIVRDIINDAGYKRNRWRKGIDHYSKTAGGRGLTLPSPGRWRSLLICARAESFNPVVGVKLHAPPALAEVTRKQSVAIIDTRITRLLRQCRSAWGGYRWVI